MYAITDLAFDQITPARLAAAIRAHWGIGKKLHWVGDATLCEDRGQVFTGSGPAVMARLRNVVFGILRLAGAHNVAAASRQAACHLADALTLMA